MMPREQIKNVAQTTTTGTVDGVTDPVTVPVTSASLFPTTGNFHIKIDNEILKVTAVSGLNFTASRAQEGTTIATHASGATVSLVITAQSIKNLINERVVTVEMTPPVESGFAWVNQGTATLSEAQGWSYLSDIVAFTDNYRLRVKATPSTPYTKTICVFLNTSSEGTDICQGLILRNSATGAFTAFHLRMTTNVLTLHVNNYTNPTTITSGGYTGNIGMRGDKFWLRVEDDGTNRFYYTSSDGTNFNLIFTEANNAHTVADQYGYGLNPYGAAVPGSGTTGVNILSLD